MDFEDQRRLFAMLPIGHQGHIMAQAQIAQQTTSQQQQVLAQHQHQPHQQQQDQQGHTRILIGDSRLMVGGTRGLDVDVTTLANISSHMTNTMAGKINHHYCFYFGSWINATQIPTQMTVSQHQVPQQISLQQQQPQQPISQQQGALCLSNGVTAPGTTALLVAVEGETTTLEVSQESLEVVNNQTQPGTEPNTITGIDQRWCLVCNKGLPQVESQDCVNLFKASMTVSHRKLSTMLGRLVGLTLSKAHSDMLCRRCFGLVEQVDGLEIELADTKMELVQQYESTVGHRQPHAKKEVECPSLEADVEWEDTGDSEYVDNEDDDPDCMSNGAKRRKKVCKSKRKIKVKKASKLFKLLTKIKSDTMDVENAGDGSQQKRNRGRPRKKDKEEDDEIPPGAPTKECPACKKVVLSKNYLIHLSTHRLFPCPFCESLYKRKDIKNHIAEAHQEEIHFPCTECDEVFDTFMQLRQHCLVVHMGVEQEKYLCKTCNKTFSSATGLKVHIETIHEKAQVYECPVCKESFNQKGNMQNHYRRLHQGEEARKLLCDICSKGFICPSDLRKHVERVHLKVRKNEVMCDLCGKPFSDSRAMRIHINAVHTKEVQHPCPDCKMVFHSLTNMVTHRRRMHGGAEGRKHICEVCHKGFCSPSDLKTHIRVVHENVRKFVCDICGQAFKVCSHLKYHRRKHTGETPYECPHCGKRFHGPSHISDHVKKVHKTMYIGANQRRKLNLPESAPPPPPGMLPSRNKVEVKNKPVTPSMNMVHSTGGSYTTGQPMTCIPVSNMTNFNSGIQHSGNMIVPAVPPATMVTHHHQGIMEHHNPYTNFHFQTVDQNPTQQSPVPMVVRLLHDLQYQYNIDNHDFRLIQCIWAHAKVQIEVTTLGILAEGICFFEVAHLVLKLIYPFHIFYVHVQIFLEIHLTAQ
ncbi:unnamed protein product, partial [Meganyctiphanes norvegica]